MVHIGNTVVLFLILASTHANGATLQAKRAEMKTTANPIRRVVTMLQMMQNKIEAEGKKAEELFEKFMCYCKTTEESLTASIEDAETRIPQLESDIKETTELHAKLGQELTQHKADREEAKEEVAKAVAIREKEAKEFMAESGDTQSNIDALGKAIPAIEKGMSGSFLQTSAGAQLRRLSLTQELSVADRDMLSAFLSGGSSVGGYSPGTGEILGMLKQMKDEMEKDLAEISGEENTAKMETEGMVASKKSEIGAHTTAIEEKTAREGEAAVEIATMKHDLEDTKEDLAADTKYLADLKKNCAAKEKEEEARRKSFAEELLAIAETIKMLNSDDALELFKKSIPSASAFLQVEATSGELRSRAMQMLRESRGKKHSVQVDLVLLAMHGKKAGFEKVITMIDDMTALLGKEQIEDDNKKEYCEKELDKAEDEKKEIDHDLSDVGKAIDESNNLVKALAEEMDALKTAIEELDVSVAVATQQRKKEHAECNEVLAANNAAKELIGMAKNRMQKFYNPKLYKPPPKRELSEEDRITLNMGGTLAPTNPPAALVEEDDEVAGTGVSLLQLHSKTRRRSFDDESDSDSDSDVAPPPPPAAYIAINHKKEEASGVLQMMDNLIADIDKEILEMEMEEKDAQEDYEGTMADASEKRAADSKALTEKETTKAELDGELQEHMEKKKASTSELMAVKRLLLDLHADCDWLLENYETRKTARANEIDAMKKAKAVLSGADFSLLQVTRHLKVRRG
jgi:predicted  nucleic acid-binding Zn-ribbon protein